MFSADAISRQSLVGLVREIAHAFSWRDTAKLTVGTLGAQAITVISLPLLSRLYDPEGFGVFAIVQSFATIFTLLSTLNLAGVTPTIPQSTLATRFTSALITLTGIAAVVLLIGEALVFRSTSLLSSKTHTYLFWGVVTGVTSTNFLTLRAYQIKLGMTGTVTLTQLARAIVTTVGAITYAGIVGDPVVPGLGLIISAALGDVTAIMWTMARLPTRRRWQLAPLRPYRLIQELQRRRAILFGAGWAHILISIAGQMPLWVVSGAFGSQYAGWYSLAYRVVLLPTSLVGATVTGVLSSKASVEYHRGANIGRLVRLAVSCLAVLGVCGYGLLAIAAWAGTGVVFGQKWAGASTSLMVLSIMGVSVFLSSATNFLPIMLGKARYLAIWSTTRTALEAAALLGAWKLGWSYNCMILLYAIVESVCYLEFVRFSIVSTSSNER